MSLKTGQKSVCTTLQTQSTLKKADGLIRHEFKKLRGKKKCIFPVSVWNIIQNTGFGVIGDKCRGRALTWKDYI